MRTCQSISTGLRAPAPSGSPRCARRPRAHRGARLAARLLGLALALACALTGCARNAVRATEKEFLADQIMRFDQDPHEDASDDHVLSNREGSTGGKGAKGGGCGCN
jgi:hypothetical protein